MADPSAVGEEWFANADAQGFHDLPPGVWLEVLKRLPVQHRFCASMVCHAWRSHAMTLLTPDLDLELQSGSGAAGFGRWLAVHGHLLRSLIIREYFFGHHSLPPAMAAGAAGAAAHVPSRVNAVSRVALWQGLHGEGRPLEQLRSLKVLLDDLGALDAVALGLCNMPQLSHLHLESNANIGVTGAAGLVSLTQLQELMLPTQALGDQGLQLIGANLVNLRALSVHNDGHVTDDGLAALAGLSALTRLDLQGNVSITQHAMPVLAAAVPHLLELNLSYCSMINDWGLGQLSGLQHLQELTLRGTGVDCVSQAAVEALQHMTALTCLDLSATMVPGTGIRNIAGCLPKLQVLNLSDNRGMDSFSALLPLRYLASLTKLDVSGPTRAVRHSDPHKSALCTLTQLRHLAMNHVMPYTDRSHPWKQPAQMQQGMQAADHLAPLDPATTQLAKSTPAASYVACPQEVLTTAAAVAAPVIVRLRQTAGVDAEVYQTSAATAAGSNSGSGSSSARYDDSNDTSSSATPWQQLLLGLPQLTQLSTLEFNGNLSFWDREEQHSPADEMDDHPQWVSTLFVGLGPGMVEAAVLLLGFAAAAGAGQSELQQLNLVSEYGTQPTLQQLHEASAANAGVGVSSAACGPRPAFKLQQLAKLLVLILTGAVNNQPTTADAQHVAMPGWDSDSPQQQQQQLEGKALYGWPRLLQLLRRMKRCGLMDMLDPRLTVKEAVEVVHMVLPSLKRLQLQRRHDSDEWVQL